MQKNSYYNNFNQKSGSIKTIIHDPSMENV